MSVARPSGILVRELRITIENVGEAPVVLQIGTTNNVEEYLGFVLHFGTLDGQEQTFTLLPRLMISAGYSGPLMIQLRPGRSYTRTTSLAKWNNWDSLEGVNLDVVAAASQLSIELTSRGCGERTPKDYQCWTGTLVSNTLRLPQ